MSEPLTTAQRNLYEANLSLSDKARGDAYASALQDFTDGVRAIDPARYPTKGYFWLRAYEANLKRFVECEQS